ncbi:MAG: glycosyltransferase family 4 protein [Proteobacteria bacterium]|nr:glycosyltransferase family 4 protein [Pseudomonadota bacterium]
MPESSAFPLALASMAVSALTTWLSIRYAHRRALFDLPGQRRSHSAPTPRGGGTGIVVASLLFFCGPFLLTGHGPDRAFGLAVAFALVLVAAVGWWDDHRPLSARTRILVHFAAALVLLVIPAVAEIPASPAVVAQGWKPGWMSFGVALTLLALLSVIVVWSINLHNFMDGINGILACQAIFVFVVLGALTSSPGHQLSMWVLAAATLGFLPFNFPRARIFMGDVGSGALGLLVAVAAGMSINTTRPLVAPALIAVSAFAVDATCTLVSRMLRRRRWLSAHREHLYQWMTRTGMSHTRVVLCYGLWNLLIVLPVLLWCVDGNNNFQGRQATFPVVAHGNAEVSSLLDNRMWNGCAATVAIYMLGVAVWIFGKRWCLKKIKDKAYP